MKTISKILFTLTVLVACVIAGRGYGQGPDTKTEEIIIKCDTTVQKCIVVVVNKTNILLEQDQSIISRLGLLPSDLISIAVEHDLQKKMPELWRAIPIVYRKKLDGAMIIKYRGEIDLDF